MTGPVGHHRRSIRLHGYDYSQAGAYYVTIVTQARACILGEIVHGALQLSQRGQIADTCWRRIPQHFPQIELGAFIMMPNHVHGIPIVHDQQATISAPPVVAARHGVPLQQNVERFGKPVSGSLATVVRQYKSSVTRKIVQQFGGVPRVWQRNYFEHILRDADEWNRIHLYIETNATNGDQDNENPDHSLAGSAPP